MSISGIPLFRFLSRNLDAEEEDEFSVDTRLQLLRQALVCVRKEESSPQQVCEDLLQYVMDTACLQKNPERSWDQVSPLISVLANGEVELNNLYREISAWVQQRNDLDISPFQLKANQLVDTLYADSSVQSLMKNNLAASLKDFKKIKYDGSLSPMVMSFEPSPEDEQKEKLFNTLYNALLATFNREGATPIAAKEALLQYALFCVCREKMPYCRALRWRLDSFGSLLPNYDVLKRAVQDKIAAFIDNPHFRYLNFSEEFPKVHKTIDELVIALRGCNRVHSQIEGDLFDQLRQHTRSALPEIRCKLAEIYIALAHNKPVSDPVFSAMIEYTLFSASQRIAPNLQEMVLNQLAKSAELREFYDSIWGFLQNPDIYNLNFKKEMKRIEPFADRLVLAYQERVKPIAPPPLIRQTNAQQVLPDPRKQTFCCIPV